MLSTTDGPFDLTRIGSGLAFSASLDDLTQRLQHGSLVVQAPPGAGKTTFAPPVVANHLHHRASTDAATRSAPPVRVVVTAPRRVAVRAAARRLAQLSGRAELVGYTVRGERTTTDATRVEFVTPGVLLRRLLSDPGLPRVGAVLLDEVHERDLDTDLLVGMLAEVSQLREDLVLIAMSATLDAARFAHLLGDGSTPAPVVTAQVAQHPLTIRYAPPPAPAIDHRGVTHGFLDHVAAQSVSLQHEVIADDPGTDVLVFLPGVREVHLVAERIRAVSPGVDVLELHGSLSSTAQDQVVSDRRAGGRPRVVVSTALAESALTVPGIRAVVDAGLSREPRRDSVRGMHGLVTLTESKASADQRAGRAARLGPGVVVRCFSELTYQRAAPFGVPEIESSDLTEAALLLAAWGAPAGDGLALPTPPPATTMADATARLRGLGALDEEQRPTALGRRLLTLPVDPRLGRALLDGAQAVGPRLSAEVVALLGDDMRGDDVSALLTALRSGRHPASTAWRRQARRLERETGLDAPSRGSAAAGHDGTDHVGTSDETREYAPGLVVALARPDWIARRDGDTYLLASGTRAGLSPASPLSGREWLAIADVTRAQGRDTAGTGALIRSAAALDEATALEAGGHLVQDTTTTEVTDSGVRALRQRRLGAIPLRSAPVRPGAESARAAVREALRREFPRPLEWSPAAGGLRRRPPRAQPGSDPPFVWLCCIASSGIPGPTCATEP